MKKMRNKNIIIWIALLALTSVNYFLPGYLSENGLMMLIILLTITKVMLVAYQFMELKKAHAAWVFMLFFILVLYGGFTIGLHFS